MSYFASAKNEVCYSKNIEFSTLPWRSDRVESGDDTRNVNGCPLRNIDIRQNGQWKHNTEEEEGHHVSYDLSHEEEAIDHIHLLKQCYFLQNQRWVHLSTSQYIKPSNIIVFVLCFQNGLTLFLMISITIFLNRFAGPQDHRCC